MAVHIKGLESADIEFLCDMYLSMYLEGECYAFAIALHRGLCWPMEGLVRGGTIRHAMVRRPEDGALFDARGFVKEEEVGMPFGISDTCARIDVSEESLRAIRFVHEATIQRARRIAEVVWPDLPWKDSFRERVRVFAEELEQLSRKHGLWIRAGEEPRITTESGDEAGYILRPTVSGAEYSLDRMFAKAA